MQRFALDPEERLIFIDEAKKNIHYRCPECLASMQIKRGIKKRAHFSHRSDQKRCRQKGVGVRHLKIQQALTKLFFENQISMEQFFPKIQRIADLCWEKEKIIFEVQCSFISLKEIQQRISDYRSLGYEVVFLFDELKFNKKGSFIFQSQIKPFYFFHLNRNSLYFYDILTADSFSKSYPIARSIIDLKSPLKGNNSLFFKNDFIDLKNQNRKKALFAKKESLEKLWKSRKWYRYVQTIKKRLHFISSFLFRYIICKIH